MASKRAVQLLPLRTSASLLRSQCVVSRPIAPRATVVRQAALFKPQTGIVQQRWHSVASGEQKSKVYEFEDVKKLVEDPKDATLLVDVREPAEYSENTIPTSLNIPITSNPDALLLTPEDFLDRFGFEKPPLDKQMVFFCKAGVRSSAAAAIAKQGGYQHVGEYRGSWLDWMKKGGLGTKGGPSGSEAKTGARDAWDHGIKGGEQGLKGGKKEAGEVDSGFNTGETGKGSQEYVPPGGWAEGTNQDPKKTTSGE